MDDPPLMASAAAAASSGAAGVNQPQMASAAAAGAASSGAAMDVPPMASADAASPGADGAHVLSLIDVQALRTLVAARDWENAEKELKTSIVVGEDEDPVKVHPCLFIPVYQGWIADHIEKKELGAALKLFGDKVAVLYDIESDFVNINDLKQQVNRLHQIANFKATMKATSVERIQTTIDDYLFLYFPNLLRHDKQPVGYSHLWRFAKMIEKPAGQKDPSFMCLACGASFNNCTISKMRGHLDIEARGRTCPKLTKNMQLRFEGENLKRNMDPEHHAPGERPSPSRHGKVGRTAKQNLAILDNPPAAEEGTESSLVENLVDAVHASAQSLQIVSVGKPLEPEVEERLKVARDILSGILSQQSKHG